jgi:hypothetical protein
MAPLFLGHILRITFGHFWKELVKILFGEFHLLPEDTFIFVNFAPNNWPQFFDF